MGTGGPLRRWIIGLFAVFLLTGCRRTELLEGELRAKDAQYREALEDQQRAENRLEALQRELNCMRSGGTPLLPEHAAAVFGVRRITLGRGTGGYDLDAMPGDELLQVVVEPRDGDEHVIKAPGTLQILVLEVSSSGMKQPISSWEIAPDNLRQYWKQGLLSTGYILQLPWKQFPRTDQVRIVTRLSSSDGRVFEADKDVKVHVMPGAIASNSVDCPIQPSDQGLQPIPQTLPAPKMIPGQVDPFILPSSQLTPIESRSGSSPIGVRLSRPQPIAPLSR